MDCWHSLQRMTSSLSANYSLVQICRVSGSIPLLLIGYIVHLAHCEKLIVVVVDDDGDNLEHNRRTLYRLFISNSPSVVDAFNLNNIDYCLITAK